MDSSETSFGPVRVIPGHRGSRFPACTSIFIEKRDALILGVLSRPRTLRELSEMGLIYDRKFLIDEWIFMWNEIMVKKHLSRLVRNGLVVETEEGFVAR